MDQGSPKTRPHRKNHKEVASRSCYLTTTHKPAQDHPRPASTDCHKFLSIMSHGSLQARHTFRLQYFFLFIPRKPTQQLCRKYLSKQKQQRSAQVSIEQQTAKNRQKRTRQEKGYSQRKDTPIPGKVLQKPQVSAKKKQGKTYDRSCFCCSSHTPRWRSTYLGGSSRSPRCRRKSDCLAAPPKDRRRCCPFSAGTYIASARLSPA